MYSELRIRGDRTRGTSSFRPCFLIGLATYQGQCRRGAGIRTSGLYSLRAPPLATTPFDRIHLRRSTPATRFSRLIPLPSTLSSLINSLLLLIFLGLPVGVRLLASTPILIGHHDFGPLTLGEEATQTLIWTNRLGAGVSFDEAVSSCECLQILAYPKRVATGAYASLRVRITPTSSGDFRYSAVIKGNGGDPMLLATFAAQVLPSNAAGDAKVAGADKSITPAELLRSQASGGTPLLVDIRPRSRFLAAHVPRSLNLGLHEIRGRAFLRRRPLVLVGDGHETPALMQQFSF